MKIAISGKGGVGKSTLAAIIALTLAERGKRVLALDADPDANLACALGISKDERAKIPTIAQQLDLIEERTGARVGTYGQMFSLTPRVDDVAELFAYTHRNVELVVLGAARRGGGGCACPENAFLKAIVDNLVLDRGETLVMDMEAGIEHLGRATAQSVDALIVVVEPGSKSLDCAALIRDMAADIGLCNLVYVGSKIADDADEEFLRKELGESLVCCLPFSDAIRTADRSGICPYDVMGEEWRVAIDGLIEKVEQGGNSKPATV